MRESKDFRFLERSDGSITILDYIAPGIYDEKVSKLVFPSEIGGKPVTYIDRGTSYPHITDIVISEGIERIGEWAFFGNDGLKTLELPESLTKIDDYAFSECHNLWSINYAGTRGQWQKTDIGRGNEVLLIVKCKGE